MPRTKGSRNKPKAKPKAQGSMIQYRRRPFKVTLGGYNFTRYAQTVIGSNNVLTLSSLVTENGFTFTFSLSQIRNPTDFTNLFDMYQITKVDLYLKLISNPDASTVNTLAGGYFPVLWFIRDYDDGGTLSVATMQEKQGAKRIVLKPDMINKISVVPKFQKMVYQTLTSTGYGPGSGFLDCVDSTVPHFALKTVLQAPNAGVDWYVECQAKYHISFKGPQ